MSFQKGLWAAMALFVMAGVASADPMRTVFTKENKFPEAMGWEVFLGGGFSSYEGDDNNKLDTGFGSGGGRFGVTDRLALLAEIPVAYYSSTDDNEFGLGDVSVGTEFLFFEDIFEYAWIIPHANLIFATGNEDKGLGQGKTQAEFGLSVGTTVNDVLHFAADASYIANGGIDEEGDYEKLLTGSLSIIWDLDARASLLGEIRMRDDTLVEDASYGYLAHAGMSYRINENFTLMIYGGGASDLAVDYYGMGRVVYQF